jgi:hypothetical protein
MHKQLILAEVKEPYRLTVKVTRLVIIDYFLKEDKIEYATSILLLCYNELISVQRQTKTLID